MRVRNIEESILSLKNNITQLVENDLMEIYNSAGIYFNGELKRTYEEMVLFHNDIIKNKISFLESELLKKKEEIETVNKKSMIFMNKNHPYLEQSKNLKH